MANKYGIWGAAYNGDGTTSSEAASDGAAGAWKMDQAAGAILEGTAPTYGTLAAGDVVYLRSKTGNGANANISVSHNSASKTLGAGSGIATLASPVTWILDDGTTWSSQNGTLTYTTSGDYGITLRPYNRFIAKTKHNWILENTKAIPNATMTFYGVETVGMKVSYPNRTSVGVANYGAINFDGGVHTNLKFFTKQLANAAIPIMGVYTSPSYGNVIVLNGFELETTDTPNSAAYVFAYGGYGAGWKVVGGRIYGAGATAGHRLCSPPSNFNNVLQFESVGFQIPKTVQFGQAATARLGMQQIAAYGLDGGPGGEIWGNWGNADSRNYSYNYPTLNATLPDSAGSATAWRLVPEFATWLMPAYLDISKLYTSAAAQKKVTLELLVSDNWGTDVINRNTVWMEVSYIDNSSGNEVTETTRLPVAGTALDASTASWSSTSWGSVTFTATTGGRGKRKLELTTAGSIKQDTSVTVRLICTAKCTNVSYDIFIVCPDVQLSTP
jgi:hypothetical protein